MKNCSEKPKSQKSENLVEEPDLPQPTFEVDKRVKFRVNKKLSKVLFLSGGKKGSIKKACEGFAKVLEENVREKSKEFNEYKNCILGII